jgi:phosphodiesterase/alkaline phosphatase D-like protein
MLLGAGCVYAPAAGAVSFPGGVASGDVTSSRAILWTRADTAENYKVEGWTNSSLSGPKAFKGKQKTDASKDFTLKIDVTGLTPNTQYWFRFQKDEDKSPVGTFKTAPASGQSVDVELAYTGDADGTLKPDNTPAFNNFETLGALDAEDPDFWVFHGDTIYADSSFRPGGPATTLAEYRDAHKLNQSYPALRNLLASTSTIATMDDHEVVNDYAGTTVDPARYAAGRKAFLEAYPIRETGLPHDPSCAGDPLYRNFKWGDEVELFVLDMRSCRSPSVAASPCLGDFGPTLPPAIRQMSPFNAFLTPNPPPGCLAAVNNPSRTLLGPAQKAQLKSDLMNSTARHKMVLGQDPIQQFHVLPYDRWEGYGAERTEILSFIQNNGIDNVEFLTTDLHATLLQNQVSIDLFTAPTPIAMELVTGPIATNSYQAEVLGVAGFLGLLAVQGIIDFDGVDCRNLNQNSYALVNANATSGVATLASKTDTGAPVPNNQFTPPPTCTTTVGP